MSDFDVQDSHDKLDGYSAPAQAVQIFGHEEQADFLVSSYASGRMHHAFLFEGPAGIGKSSLAFMFARHIIANPEFATAPLELNGHATQSLIRQIAMGAHPQVLHLTRPVDQKTGKHKTQLTIEETRKIGHFLSHTVAGNGYRIVIVDPVNDMNASAANALLKNLEEPTPRTVFILVVQSSGRLLPTIRSRCMTLRFQPLGDEAMHAALGAMGLKDRLDNKELRLLVDKANGSPRAAAMLCDSGGLEIIQTADQLLKADLFDASVAMKLGEAINAREAEPIFNLLCDDLLAQLASASRQMAREHLGKAKDISLLHDDVETKIRTALTYNLDKRQTLLDVLARMHLCLRSV
jgi:DNA polymerase-3 subunit delta'